ncbi:MAG: hypothetical protein WCE44_01395 [Candidatus Velthaea sp.]
MSRLSLAALLSWLGHLASGFFTLLAGFGLIVYTALLRSIALGA